LPEGHIIHILVESGGIKVGAELLGQEVAHVIALRSMAIANAKHGRVLHPGPNNISVLIFFLSVLGFVASLKMDVVERVRLTSKH
jgi:hypothetical protein